MRGNWVMGGGECGVVGEMRVGVGGGVGRGLKEHSIPWKLVNTLVSLPF